MEAKLTKPCHKLFHQFKIKDRMITLCAIDTYGYTNKYPDYNSYSTIWVGMSITNPLDKFDEKLGKKIAEDRAVYHKTNENKGVKYIFSLDTNNQTYGSVSMFLEECEERIRLNLEKYIPSLTNKKKK